MEAVLLNSGGIDTLASIVAMKEADSELVLHSLTVWIGQKNFGPAHRAAQEIAGKHCVTTDLMLLGDFAFKENGAFKIPYRMVLFHMAAAIKARHYGVEYIISGIDDGFSENFGRKVTDMLTEESRAPYAPVVICPVRKLSRGERIFLAKKDPLFPITVSCEEAEPCCVCQKCLDRRAAGIA